MRLKELKLDWKLTLVIVYSTLALIVNRYHDLLGHPIYDGLVIYFVIPVLMIVLLFREPLTDYGFRIGEWRAGLIFTVGSCVVMGLILLLVASTADFQTYYTYYLNTLPLPIPIATLIELFAWEFFFRGFLFFALYRLFGPYAILLQAVPFALAHLGKPELETLSCIFGGSAFGYLAWRTRSFLYPFLIHWFITTVTLLIAGG